MIRFPSSNPCSGPASPVAPLPDPPSISGQGTSSRQASVEALPLALLHRQSFPNLKSQTLGLSHVFLQKNISLRKM